MDQFYDSRVNLYSPVVEPYEDNENFLGTAPRRSRFAFPVIGRQKCIQLTKICGIVLVIGLICGLTAALLVVENTTVPVIAPNVTTTASPSTTSTTTVTTTATTTTTTTTTIPTTTTLPPHFPPPTKRPLPKNPEDVPPVSLLYMMENIGPEFTEIPCFPTVPPVFKYNVTVSTFNFTSPGADTLKLAKKGAAMVANEALFGFTYPNGTYPIPTHNCTVIHY